MWVYRAKEVQKSGVILGEVSRRREVSGRYIKRGSTINYPSLIVSCFLERKVLTAGVSDISIRTKGKSNWRLNNKYIDKISGD